MRRLDHTDPKSESGANVDAAITCITPMPQLVYTGDDDGRVVSSARAPLCKTPEKQELTNACKNTVRMEPCSERAVGPRLSGYTQVQ